MTAAHTPLASPFGSPEAENASRAGKNTSPSVNLNTHPTTMKHHTIRTTAAVLFCAVLLPSCATTQDGRATQAQGTAVGAALGGILAGGLAYAITGDASSAAKFAAIGAGVGAAQGFAYGTQVAAKKADYATQEDYLNYAIGEAQQRNVEAVAYNQKLEAEVNTLEQRVRSMPQDRRQKLQLQKDINTQLGAVDKEDKKYEAWIADLKGAVEGEGYGDKPQAAQMRKEIQKLEAEKAALQGRRTRLASSKALLSV